MENKRFLKFTNAVNGDGQVDIDGEIGESLFWGGYSFNQLKYDLQQVTGDIVVNIKSYGGDLFEALAMYDYLRALKNNVTTRIVGATASSGTVIALAGDKRLIAPNARYLIHKPMVGVMGNSDELRAALDTLDSLDRQMVNLYTGRTRLSDTETLELMVANKWLSAEQALQMGFVDGYTEEKQVDKPAQNTNVKQNEDVMAEKEKETEKVAADAAGAVVKNKTDTAAEASTEAAAEASNEAADEAVAETNTEAEPEVDDAVQARLDALEAENEQLRNQLRDHEVAEAESRAQEVENIVNAAIADGKITADTKERWQGVGHEKGVDELQAFMNSIPAPVAPIKLSNVITSAEVVNEKEAVVNKWKAGKITTEQYLAAIKNVK